MSERNGVTHVCPQKDIVCGNRPENWCSKCPLRDAAPPAPCEHNCSDDAISQSVCEGLYQDRTDECLGLVSALKAVIGLCGGHDEQAKAITKICEDAITEYASWTR